MNLFKCCDNQKCFFNGGNMDGFMALHSIYQQYNNALMHKMFAAVNQHMQCQQNTWPTSVFPHNPMGMNSDFMHNSHQHNCRQGEAMMRSLWEHAANFAQSYIQLTQDLAHNYMQWHEKHTCGKSYGSAHSETSGKSGGGSSHQGSSCCGGSK